MKTVYVCGMASEAALLPKNALVIVSAGDKNKLYAAMCEVNFGDGEFSEIISFGVCGGINPNLKTGDLAKTITSVDIPEITAVQKRMLFHWTVCDGVDNETGCAKAFAEKFKLPFKIQRVILDTASEDLPPAACLPLKADGTPDGWAIAWSVMTKPWQIPALMRLGGQQKIALKVLAGLAGK